MAVPSEPEIWLDTKSPPHHTFNSHVIGLGRLHPNQSTIEHPCVISIQAFAPSPNQGEKPLFEGAATLTCHVNTDLQPTVLDGRIAAHLGLLPLNPVLERVKTGFGFCALFCCKYTLLLTVGPGYLSVEVWFPVEHMRNGWQWRRGFPQWNVLGMRGVLEHRLLCVSPDRVYAFERLAPKPSQAQTP